LIPPGTLILGDRFRVLQLLGEGGMGEVYLGEQVSLGRKVAIKMLHPELYALPEITERFKREARLLSSVEHPAVVRVIDYGDTGQGACLVMEYVEGESLYTVLQQGPLPLPRALPLLYQLAEGLVAIHDKGIIHRDIKPENVLLSRGPRGEQARLLDFGIARLATPQAASNVSQVGMVLGTPEYLSPEQALGAPVDARSDLYSFGVLAYRVLSGLLPFPGPGPSQYVAQHASVAPWPLAEAAPALASQPALVALVMRLLEKEPAKRLQEARSLVAVLGALAGALMGPGATLPGMALTVATVSSGHGAPLPSPTPSGTAFYGAQASSPGTSAPVRGGTALLGPRPSGSTLAHPGGTLASRPQNLTVLLATLKGFTERTSRQTHEQNARMMETYEGLLLPLVRAHGGRLGQQRGDALLATFPSPTGAVLCGMAMQDRLWRHNQGCAPEERLHVRTCLHAGEVLLTREAVVGEPVEVVKAVDHAAEAGEVTFTEAVNLARNRAEAEAEPCGSVGLPGSGEPLQLYRCLRAAEGPPFKGRDEAGPRHTSLGVLAARLEPALRPVRQGLTRVEARVRERPRLSLGMGLGLAVLLGLAGLLVVRANNPLAQARALVEEGQAAEALRRLEELPAEARAEAEAQRVRAVALHALKRHKEEHAALAALDAPGREEVEEQVLDGLAEDYGEGEGNKGLRKLLGALPAERVRAYFAELSQEEHSPRQWGALRYLDAEQATRGLELVELYVKALESKDCEVRARAARRLGTLGQAEAIPALERLSQAPKEKAPSGAKGCGQDEAAEALRALKKKQQG
jgi:serine/threonine-protein kinase